jgi:hypothetical protein
MSETKADQLAGTKISRRAHTWCTKEQADFIAAKLSSLALIEAELADEKLHVKQLERGLDKLLEVNKVLVGLVKRYRAETPLGNQPHMITGEADEALKLAGESV